MQEANKTTFSQLLKSIDQNGLQLHSQLLESVCNQYKTKQAQIKNYIKLIQRLQESSLNILNNI